MSVIQQAIQDIQKHKALDAEQAYAVFTTIMAGETTPAQIGALLMGMSMRGEVVGELVGAARAMREAAVKITPKSDHLLDTCGTGGDGASTFNISTTTALVVAAAGQKVAKHGNRSVSSKSGSADVLESLGVAINLAPERVADCIDTVGVGFLFAPGHHPAMKHAAGPRREMGVRSIFNLLGPLTNPAGADFQILGVYDKSKLELIGKVLLELGITRALVVHGRDGLDEITITACTDAIWVEQDKPLQALVINPVDHGLTLANAADLRGDDADFNARITQSILQGETGAKRDIVLMNAAAGLWVSSKVDSLQDGIALAADAIDSGKAMRTLQQLIEFSQTT